MALEGLLSQLYDKTMNLGLVVIEYRFLEATHGHACRNAKIAEYRSMASRNPIAGKHYSASQTWSITLVVVPLSNESCPSIPYSTLLK